MLFACIGEYTRKDLYVYIYLYVCSKFCNNISFYLCISINNILTLFIMTRPVHSGQVNFYLFINKLVPYQSFTWMDV